MVKRDVGRRRGIRLCPQFARTLERRIRRCRVQCGRLKERRLWWTPEPLRRAHPLLFAMRRRLHDLAGTRVHWLWEDGYGPRGGRRSRWVRSGSRKGDTWPTGWCNKPNRQVDGARRRGWEADPRGTRPGDGAHRRHGGHGPVGGRQPRRREHNRVSRRQAEDLVARRTSSTAFHDSCLEYVFRPSRSTRGGSRTAAAISRPALLLSRPSRLWRVVTQRQRTSTTP